MNKANAVVTFLGLVVACHPKQGGSGDTHIATAQPSGAPAQGPASEASGSLSTSHVSGAGGAASAGGSGVQVSGNAPGVDLASGGGDVPASLRITGQYQYNDPVRAKSLVIDNATIVCAAGKPLHFEANRIDWSGTTTFQCAGKNGGNGGNGTTWHDRGWCVGEDQGNWENNFRNGGNEAGGNGGNGENGTDGSAVTIRAAVQHFAPTTIITINTKGGSGGSPGSGGEGRQKCHAPSGADCDHGTNLKGCVRAPNGVEGLPGQSGADGEVKITGDADGVADIRVNK